MTLERNKGVLSPLVGFDGALDCLEIDGKKYEVHWEKKGVKEDTFDVYVEKDEDGSISFDLVHFSGEGVLEEAIEWGLVCSAILT